MAPHTSLSNRSASPRAALSGFSVPARIGNRLAGSYTAPRYQQPHSHYNGNDHLRARKGRVQRDTSSSGTSPGGAQSLAMATLRIRHGMWG